MKGQLTRFARRCAWSPGSWLRTRISALCLWKPISLTRVEEAQSELLRAAKSPDADQAMVQLYLGKLYARTGDFDKSIASFNNYLEKAPKAANVNDVRALIARMQDLKARKR